MSTTGAQAERKRLTQRGRFAAELMKGCQAPRLHLALIVSLTGGIGFYVAYLMLGSPLSAPWLRYPLSVVIAYLAFLLMLSSWAKRRGGEEAPATSEEGDSGPDAQNAMAAEGAISQLPISFEESIDRAMLVSECDANRAEAAAFVVVATMALLGAIWAAVSILRDQPVLLIDVLLAVLLPLALYGRVREVEGRHGMRVTLRPSVLVVVTLALLGIALHWYAPQVDSFGELLSRLAIVS